MKFQVDNLLLKAAYNKMKSLLKGLISPYHNLKLIAESEGIEIIATNFYYAMAIKVPALVKEKGEVVLDAREFSKLAESILDEFEVETIVGQKKIPESSECDYEKDKYITKPEHYEDELLIVFKGTKGKIKRETKLNYITGDDYPEVKFYDEEKTMNVFPGFVQQIKNALVFHAKESARYAWNGIYFEAGKEFQIASTDGKRAYQFKIPASSKVIPCKVIIPEHIEEFIKFMDDEVKISYIKIYEEKRPDDESKGKAIKEEVLIFRGKDYKIYTRLLDGVFPNLEKVKPDIKEMQYSLNLNFINKEFIKLIKEIKSLVPETTSHFAFKWNKDNLIIIGDKDEMTIPVFGKICDIGLDFDYVNDFVNIGSREMLSKDSQSAVLFKFETGAIGVLMPLNRIAKFLPEGIEWKA